LLKRSKQEVEVFMVERLLEALGEKVPLVFPGPDPPDTVARFKGKSIGIEVTDYFADMGAGKQGGSPLAKNRSLLDELKKWFHMGRMKFAELDYTDGRVWFARDSERGGARPLPPKKDHPQLVLELLSFAMTAAPQLQGSKCMHKQFDKDRFPMLSRHIERMDLERVGFWNLDWSWQCEGAGARSMGAFCSQRLVEIVNRKAGKLTQAAQTPNRRGFFDELWLVIVPEEPVAPNRDGASLRGLEGCRDLAEALGGQPCARVVLYNYYLGEVLEWQHGTGWRERVAVKFPR